MTSQLYDNIYNFVNNYIEKELELIHKLLIECKEWDKVSEITFLIENNYLFWSEYVISDSVGNIYTKISITNKIKVIVTIKEYRNGVYCFKDCEWETDWTFLWCNWKKVPYFKDWNTQHRWNKSRKWRDKLPYINVKFPEIPL